MKLMKLSPYSYILIWAMTLMLTCNSVRADVVKDVLVPPRIPCQGTILTLNGTAIRSKWGFNVYVVALYLNEKMHSAETIMSDREHKRIHITMLRGVSKKQFVSTIHKSIKINFSEDEQKLFATQLKAFMACFGGGSSLDRFSTINVDYVPNKGMLVEVNDGKAKLIPGEQFYHAILRLWIGQPLQASIKTGLVGKN
ncbi:MAG: chalcone isomerase family protein [Verrucomicrobiales bacterium]|nr:chalcone isomerase family protein [Verrucomicrobiales bacterium]